jgi:CRISPR-associated protein Csm5
MPEYIVKAKTLFPVHIGGGPEHFLDPLGYVVKDNMFYRVKVEAMMTADSSFAKEFMSLIDKNKIVDLRKIISEKFDPQKKAFYSGKASISKAFKSEYESKFLDVNNQLLVQCMTATPAGSVYIPGSSIKGAIRTAILDHRARESKDSYNGIAERANNGDNRFFAKRCENIILDMDNPKNDPFKALKISDASIPEGQTEIVQVKNCGKSGTPLGIAMFVEAVKPDVDFQFTLKLENRKPTDGIRMPLFMNDIFNDTTAFYQEEIKYEESNFYQGKESQKWVDRVFDETTDNEAVLRIGRFSHIESMTYNSPEVLRSHKKKSGTTRNLVDGKIPLGMIKMEFVKV